LLRAENKAFMLANIFTAKPYTTVSVEFELGLPWL
jgi:hypothetical protein